MTDDLSKEPPVDRSTQEELSKLAKLKTVLPSEMKKETTPPPTSTSQSTMTKQDSSLSSPLPPFSELITPPTSKPVAVADLPLTKKSKEEEEALKLSSDAYNGSKTEKYVWAQTVSDIDIRVPVPKATTGKDLKVDIKIDTLKIEILRPQREVCVFGYTESDYYFVKYP